MFSPTCGCSLSLIQRTQLLQRIYSLYMVFNSLICTLMIEVRVFLWGYTIIKLEHLMYVWNALGPPFQCSCSTCKKLMLSRCDFLRSFRISRKISRIIFRPNILFTKFVEGSTIEGKKIKYLMLFSSNIKSSGWFVSTHQVLILVFLLTLLNPLIFPSISSKKIHFWKIVIWHVRIFLNSYKTNN